MDLHNKIIHFNEIASLPNRVDFLDEKMYCKVSEQIADKAPILFMPNYVDNMNMQSSTYSKSLYKMVMVGIFEDGRKSKVVVHGIKPYFEVKVPKNMAPMDFKEYLENTFPMSGDSDFRDWAAATDNKSDKHIKFFKIDPTEYKFTKGKPLKYYQEHEDTYIQIYFNKLTDRKYCIQYLRAKGYETSHDDLTCYHRVVCRDYLLSFCSWIQLSDYTKDDLNKNRYIKGAVYNVNINNISLYEMDDPTMIEPHLRRDNLMTMCWDIETYNSDNDGLVPLPNIMKTKTTIDPNTGKEINEEVDTGVPNMQHKIFMIGITFQWYHSDKQLLRVCLVDHPSNPHPDFLTIVCDNEENLIRAFARCFGKMSPDIVSGFNDASYDWPWIINRAKVYPHLLKYVAGKFDILKESTKKTEKDILYSYKSINIKIENEVYAKGYNLQLFGYLPIDVMIVFRQLYSTSEQWSLNYFLKENKLGGKKDMPYTEMFDIYASFDEAARENRPLTNAQKDQMRLVAEYCVIDSQRCHELLKIRSVIQDKREVSKLSYITLYDSFYTAVGMKVRNLVIANASLKNLKISNITLPITETGKYPGAYVFPPIKGLVTSKLSIAECVQKAAQGYEKYAGWLNIEPHIIEEAKNFIKEKGCLYNLMGDEDKQYIETLPPCIIQFFKNETGRPITGLDFSSLYPSLIMTYNLSPEYIINNKKYAKELSKTHDLHKIKFTYNGRIVRGWAIRHDNKIDKSAPDYKFGIFCEVLKKLFDARTQMKKSPRGLKYWEEKIENMKNLPKEELEQRMDEFNEAKFEFAQIDSKQRALKVYMNTFYGQVGSKMSALYMLEVAGGVTTSGQYNVKLAHNFITNLGCKIYYGDTDSLYISMPEKTFEELDKIYYSGQMEKLDYWKEMVRLTFEEIKNINKQVNDMFIKDNGTTFLKMAFEESLFPVLFTAKKKYVGVSHVIKPNFTIDDKHPLFVKGLALKTRGVSEILKDVCNDILKSTMVPENILTVREIIKNKIREIYTKEWGPDDFEKFIMTGVYKPNKKNVQMHCFHDRMINERGIYIKPGERTNYVVVKKYPFNFDERGRTIDLSIGDLMELAEIAKQECMSIDLSYYMDKKINGQLARFMSYHKDFQVHISNYHDDDEVKKAEAKIIINARKYIENYSEQYHTKYVNKGTIYKSIFKITSKTLKTTLMEKFDGSAYTNSTIKLLSYSIDSESAEFYTWILERVIKDVESKKYNKLFGERYVKAIMDKIEMPDLKTKKIIQMQKNYYSDKKNNILIVAQKIYDERQLVLESRLKKSLNKIKELFKLNNQIIGNMTKYIKKIINIDNEYNVEYDEEEKKELPEIEEILVEKNIDIDVLNKDLSNILTNDMKEHIDILHTGLQELKFLYINLVSNYEYLYQIKSIIEHLKILRDKKTRIVNRPDSNIIEQSITKMIDDMTHDYDYAL